MEIGDFSRILRTPPKSSSCTRTATDSTLQQSQSIDTITGRKGDTSALLQRSSYDDCSRRSRTAEVEWIQEWTKDSRRRGSQRRLLPIHIGWSRNAKPKMPIAATRNEQIYHGELGFVQGIQRCRHDIPRMRLPTQGKIANTKDEIADVNDEQAFLLPKITALSSFFHQNNWSSQRH